MNLSPFIAYKENEKNPFDVNGIGERWIEKEMIKSGYVAVDEKTGEAQPLFLPRKQIKVAHDSHIYTKVFKQDVEKLGGCGKQVLLYVIYHARQSGKEIELNAGTVAKWCRMGKTSFYKGVKELLDREILALNRRKMQTFFINPNYIFNGNRTKFKPPLKVAAKPVS